MTKSWRALLLSFTACTQIAPVHAEPRADQAVPPRPAVVHAEPEPSPSAAPSSVGQDFGILITFLRSLRATHDFESTSLRFADHPIQRSWMAARTEGGGFVVASRRRTPTKRNPYRVVATVTRIDAGGQVEWTADVGEAKFVTFEVPGLIATPDGGVIAHVLAYKHPARNGHQRFVKLDRAGHREWAIQLPGGVDTDAPHVNFMTLMPDGSVALSGYWVRSSELTSKHDWTGHLRAWRGQLAADGQLVESTVGDVLLDDRVLPWPEANPIGDAVDAP